MTEKATKRKWWLLSLGICVFCDSFIVSQIFDLNWIIKTIMLVLFNICMIMMIKDTYENDIRENIKTIVLIILISNGFLLAVGLVINVMKMIINFVQMII